jgi:large subunit ribosomal protein L25
VSCRATCSSTRSRDKPIHLRLPARRPDSRITVQVPVHFEERAGSRRGVKRGGVLNVVRMTDRVLLRPKANKIPESFTVDLTGLEIGDSIHISSTLAMPEGVQAW